MTNYSFFTFDIKDEHGRYVGNILYGDGGIAPFHKCYYNYKPNRKGGHRHNHLYNVCHRITFRSKSARHRVSREDKRFFTATFYTTLKLNPQVLGDILKRRKRCAN